MIMTVLVLATSNRNKVREIRALLPDVPLATLDAWPDVTPPDETGHAFDENARQKALYYAAATGELVVAEDSGLEIDALGGAPGIESARYGGVTATYPEKFARIYDALARLEAASGSRGRPEDRTARFVCALALARGRDILFEARGIVEGHIAPEPRGAGGFGYDPIFFYPPYGRTLAEATPEEKLAVSHRGKAFRALNDFFKSQVSSLSESLLRVEP
jgi:XTP/dITP diphosphohydrolase